MPVVEGVIRDVATGPTFGHPLRRVEDKGRYKTKGLRRRMAVAIPIRQEKEKIYINFLTPSSSNPQETVS